MGRLSELQRSLNAGANASCGDVAVPSEDAAQYRSNDEIDRTAKFHQLYNEIIAIAFMCGTSRIAVIHAYETWSTYAGDWHQDVAHQYNTPDKQAVLLASNRAFFEQGFMDLVQRLDVEEDGGKTYLDNTLMVWTQESGADTHGTFSLPIVTAGSA